MPTINLYLSNCSAVTFRSTSLTLRKSGLVSLARAIVIKPPATSPYSVLIIPNVRSQTKRGFVSLRYFRGIDSPAGIRHRTRSKGGRFFSSPRTNFAAKSQSDLARHNDKASRTHRRDRQKIGLFSGDLDDSIPMVSITALACFSKYIQLAPNNIYHPTSNRSSKTIEAIA
jgi:hypothetical protein